MSSESVFKSRGASMIAEERVRQITAEGYAPEHDDAHLNCEIALAAVSYAAPEPVYVLRTAVGTMMYRDPWPWGQRHDKRSAHGDGRAGRIRDLTKAGALIAAEIDRLLRAEGRGQ